MSHRVLVAVCTYKRLADLAALLDSMSFALTGHDAQLLVVDNDPAGSAETLVREHAINARYKICPEPGIAAARNAALAERQGFEFVAFVDDDETVEADWLTELLRGADAYGADVTTGPVTTLFPAGTAEWIIKGGFVQRGRHESGARVSYAATNNVLIRNAALDRLASPWFDLGFSRSGGSDAELSWRLVRAGSEIVWMDTARVSELAPSDRLTFRWIFKRLVRGGNANARLLARELSRRQLVTHGARRIILGVLQIARSAMTGRGLRAQDVGTLAYGVGVVRAGLGSTVYEYARG